MRLVRKQQQGCSATAERPEVHGRAYSIAGSSLSWCTLLHGGVANECIGRREWCGCLGPQHVSMECTGQQSVGTQCASSERIASSDLNCNSILPIGKSLPVWTSWWGGHHASSTCFWANSLCQHNTKEAVLMGLWLRMLTQVLQSSPTRRCVSVCAVGSRCLDL